MVLEERGKADLALGCHGVGGRKQSFMLKLFLERKFNRKPPII